MDDVDAMYRAGRARQGGMAAPKGGGYGNGGRVAKAGYARGGVVDGGKADGGAKEPVGEMSRAIPFMGPDGKPASHITGGGYARGGVVDGGKEHSRQRAQAAGKPALASGGRVKGKGC